MQEQFSHNAGPNQSSSSPHAKKSFFSLLVEYGKTILITLLAAILLKFFVIEAFRIPSTSMENTLDVGDFLVVNKLAFGFRTPRHLPLTSFSLPSLTIPFFTRVHRGDVVVFEFPGDRDEVKPDESVNYIKRCVGLPGDRVEIRFGLVRVNEIEMNFPPLGRHTSHPIGLPWKQSAELFPEGSNFSDVNYGPLDVPKRGDTLRLDPSSFYRWHVFIEREGHTVELKDSTILIDGIASSIYRIQRNYYFMLGDNRDNSMDSRYWGFVPEDHLVGEALFVYWSWDPDISVTSLSEKFSTIRWKRIGTMIR
jgi:signal peptidase I